MGSADTRNSRRGATASFMTSLRLYREENSGESCAGTKPVSNCRYPQGVIVAGVETVGAQDLLRVLPQLLTVLPWVEVRESGTEAKRLK